MFFNGCKSLIMSIVEFFLTIGNQINDDDNQLILSKVNQMCNFRSDHLISWLLGGIPSFYRK